MTDGNTSPDQMYKNAKAIADAGGLLEAVDQGALSKVIETTLSEALVLGLLRQGVSKYLAIFGHGSTDLGEVLRIYESAGVVRCFNFRNEVEMAHAATTLRWQYGETSAVVTSIGPGGLQAMAGSLASASNGIGVYHIYGDETTHGEGYNMQQVPKRQQGLFGQMSALMGESYILHTPEAVRDALRRGALRVNHPYQAGPFYLMLPLNTQPQKLILNIGSLPEKPNLPRVTAADDEAFVQAAQLICDHDQIVIKAGGGTRDFAAVVNQFAEEVGAAVALSPGSLGVLLDANPQNMHVGGSKGSISGNFAMSGATLLIAIGSRAVCQADCSGIGYDAAEAVININGDLGDLTHYNKTLGLPGDIGATLEKLLATLANAGGASLDKKSTWLSRCAEKKAEWGAFKAERYAAPPVMDEVWGKAVLTQPAALKTVADFAKKIGAAKYFDAGDVQANGFQIMEDDDPAATFTETGASYMGYSASSVLAGAMADNPQYSIAFCGDGSFMMNPQALIDGVQHGAKGMIVIFDNRRMAAITGLQEAQYGHGYKTNDSVAVDYVAMASSVSGISAHFGGEDTDSLNAALAAAHAHDGLSVVHVPVYCGPDPLGGMGAYGSWNVGNWCEDVQTRYHTQDI